MAAICSSAVVKSISGNMAWISLSDMPLSSRDWICAVSYTHLDADAVVGVCVVVGVRPPAFGDGRGIDGHVFAVGPVSYTHLHGVLSRGDAAIGRHTLAARGGRVGFELPDLHRLLPVSYTHLDVYKRQQL